MPSYDPRVDAYIAKAADFAQPVLRYLRGLVHEVCPDVQETLKWSMPYFEHHGLLCGFAAFKKHCSFGFRKAALLRDPGGVLQQAGESGMGSFGKLTCMDDLPEEKAIRALLREAVLLNEEGVRLPPEQRRRAGPAAALAEPAYLTELLAANAAAKATWDAFPPSHRREYMLWITEARTEPTRQRRLAQTIQQLAEGKHRNWKYERRAESRK